MKTDLRPRLHDSIPGEIAIDLWYDGAYIGCLYAADGPGVRIISKHPATVSRNPNKLTTEVQVDTDKLTDEYKTAYNAYKMRNP